jgi:hypothetical protein
MAMSDRLGQARESMRPRLAPGGLVGHAEAVTCVTLAAAALGGGVLASARALAEPGGRTSQA